MELWATKENSHNIFCILIVQGHYEGFWYSYHMIIQCVWKYVRYITMSSTQAGASR